LHIEGLTEDNILVSPKLGQLRSLLEAAQEDVAAAKKAKLCKEEISETEAIQRAKAEAKDSARESLKDTKKVPAAVKVELEGALGTKHPATPGLSGKAYSATGRRFLQALLKTKLESCRFVSLLAARYRLNTVINSKHAVCIE
jgi:predicted transcriptional regulator